MVIIAESGATKTAWKSIDDMGNVRSVKTGGMSPTCLDHDHIQSLIREAIPLLNPLGTRVDTVHFYGAGLVSDEVAAPIRAALDIWCPFAEMTCSLRRWYRCGRDHGHGFEQLPVLRRRA